MMYARIALLPPPARKIIFVHGLAISGTYMTPTLERLAGQFSVMAPDLPGFGRSQKPSYVLDVPQMADSLAGWMRATAQWPAVLVGNSVGCQVAVDLACRFPQYVDRMILGAPTPDPAAPSALRQIGRVILDAPREAWSLDLLAVHDYLQAGIFRAISTARQAVADPIRQKLPQVRVPTLVVCGSRDPIVPVHWARQVSRLLPLGGLAIIAGAPHALNYTTPDQFVALIRGFLDEDSSHASPAEPRNVW